MINSESPLDYEMNFRRIQELADTLGIDPSSLEMINNKKFKVTVAYAQGYVGMGISDSRN